VLEEAMIEPRWREEAAEVLTKLGGAWSYHPGKSGKTPLLALTEFAARVEEQTIERAAKVVDEEACSSCGCDKIASKIRGAWYGK